MGLSTYFIKNLAYLIVILTILIKYAIIYKTKNKVCTNLNRYIKEEL